MTMPEIRPLNSDHIHQANYNSMGGTRGDSSARSYEIYCRKVLEWPVSDEKKQSILDNLHKKWSELLSHEARHVSWIVAGPARYNAKKLDHGDVILRLNSEFVEWFQDLEQQVEAGSRERDKRGRCLAMIERCEKLGENPMVYLASLAALDKEKFIALYEELQPKYKWRRNTRVAKLYEAAKAGTLKTITLETFFEDANFTAYTEGDRAYIRFLMRPKRQLLVALKSRGWWWNSSAGAWSTYLDRLDREWVATISTRYAQYL